MLEIMEAGKVDMRNLRGLDSTLVKGVEDIDAANGDCPHPGKTLDFKRRDM